MNSPRKLQLLVTSYWDYLGKDQDNKIICAMLVFESCEQKVVFFAFDEISLIGIFVQKKMPSHRSCRDQILSRVIFQ